jgi:hypothetical protein
MVIPAEGTGLRCRLPDRRAHELVNFEHGGQRYTGGIGRFPEASGIAELFINAAKTGSDIEATAQETALAVSLALQHGCPLDAIRHALTREGVACGPVGALLLALRGMAEPQSGHHDRGAEDRAR